MEDRKFVNETDQAKLETASMRIEAAQIQLDKFKALKESFCYQLFVKYGLKTNEHQLNDMTGEIIEMPKPDLKPEQIDPELKIQA
jgi:hypothetical protein